MCPLECSECEDAEQTHIECVHYNRSWDNGVGFTMPLNNSQRAALDWWAAHSWLSYMIFDLLPTMICRSQKLNNGIVLPYRDKQVPYVISFLFNEKVFKINPINFDLILKLGCEKVNVH